MYWMGVIEGAYRALGAPSRDSPPAPVRRRDRRDAELPARGRPVRGLAAVALGPGGAARARPRRVPVRAHEAARARDPRRRGAGGAGAARAARGGRPARGGDAPDRPLRGDAADGRDPDHLALPRARDRPRPARALPTAACPL